MAELDRAGQLEAGFRIEALRLALGHYETQKREDQKELVTDKRVVETANEFLKFIKGN